MTPWIVWALFALFIAKHYVADFPLQRNPYTWQFKHLYWHPGGWLHAFIHGVSTFWVLSLVSLYAPITLTACAALAVADMVIHHDIDYRKMKTTKDNGWKPDTHPEFWIALGLDQLAHYATYAGIIAVVMLLV